MDAEDAVCAGLCRSAAERQGSGEKRYVEKVTGLSRAQVTRLIDQYVKSGILQTRRGRGRRFTARYTAADIALLAEVDEAHKKRSASRATRKVPCTGVLRVRRCPLPAAGGEFPCHAHL